MKDVTTEAQSRSDGSFFRPLIGLIVMAGAFGGFAALFFIKVPLENKDAMMFALGAVFQWAAGVVASEYGSTATGRKVAESAIRKIERQDIAAGETAGDPVQVEVINPPEDPANVTEAKL